MPVPPIQESTGPVASDSLAAESYRNQGGFSENTAAAISSVKGSSSTFANQDTSAARELGPAPDADARESEEAWNESSKLKAAGGLKYPEGVGGQPDFPGGHNKDGYYGGPSAGSGGKGGTARSGEYMTGLANSGSGHTGGEEYRADASAGEAPSYVGSVTGGFLTKAHLKPKGRNLQEGGFDSDDAQNASFTGEVGTENDPGRAAEQKMQRANVQVAGGVGNGLGQKGVETGGVGYGNLEVDEQA